MLFGDLKGGGTLAITVVEDKLSLIATAKESKLPLLTVDSTDYKTDLMENAN
jgi:hypothetical protein